MKKTSQLLNITCFVINESKWSGEQKAEYDYEAIQNKSRLTYILLVFQFLIEAEHVIVKLTVTVSWCVIIICKIKQLFACFLFIHVKSTQMAS